MVELILGLIGLTLLLIGAFLEIMGAIGMTRLQGFFNRVHAATVSAIGGSVTPLIGVSLLSLALEELGIRRFYVAGNSLTAALLILILAPAGTHALARAAYKSREVLKNFVYDALEEDKRGLRQ